MAEHKIGKKMGKKWEKEALFPKNLHAIGKKLGKNWEKIRKAPKN